MNMKTIRSLVIGCLAASWAGASALGDVTIIGALSNFDCPNNTPEICDEFEIEFEGPHPEDVLHTYCNWNYGCPTVTSNASGTGVIIDYKRAGHTTNIGAIEHYGVTLRDWGVVTVRNFRWKHNGVVVASGHGTPPVSLPRPVVIPLPDGGAEVAEPIENEQPEESIWIRRSVITLPGEVNLEQLMFDDPIIQAALPIDPELERLGPGETLEAVEPVDPEDYVQTLIIVVETFEDIATFNPGSGEWDHASGALLSRAMNATIVQARSCDDVPVVTLDPVDAAGVFDGGVNFSVEAVAPGIGGELNYQWRHDGVDMPGEDSPILNIDPLRPSDSGSYYCVISDDCGSVSTSAAQLTVFVPPACLADADGSGSVELPDVAMVIRSWGMMVPHGTMGDVDGSGGVNLSDLAVVITYWNQECR